MAKVTIGIPAYNQPEYIAQAVESALEQTFDDLLVIVSDDSTNNETELVCTKFINNNRFKYIHNTPSFGRVANYRHLLYDLAAGDYFLCLDGDDYLQDCHYIERAVADLENDPAKALIFAGSSTLFEQQGVTITDQNNNRIPDTCDGDWFFINYWQGFGMTHQTILYRRQWAMDLDFYRYDISSADWESFLRLIQGHKIGHRPEKVSVWRKHGRNETRHITLESILNNRQFMTAPLEMAHSRGVFTAKDLQIWHDRMAERYYVKGLLRLFFTKQPLAVKELKAIIKKEERPALAHRILANPLLIMAIIIPPDNQLWRIVFKNFLKMESFYYEFAALAS